LEDKKVSPYFPLTNPKFWYALRVDIEVRCLKNKELELVEYRAIEFEIKSY